MDAAAIFGESDGKSAEKSRSKRVLLYQRDLVISDLKASFVSLLYAMAATIALVLGVGGCERQIAPPLVEVTELTPREVEPGDRLEIHGTGFPQGRSGRVTLEGTVYRSGEPPLRGVSIDAEGTVATPDRLEIVVRDSFAERFCGFGDRAAHATFQGDIHLAFASNNSGAPPLVGVLRGTQFDVLPSSARASVLEGRAAEGTHVLSFLGIVGGAPTPRGLPIEQVQIGSLAHRAALQVGDVIASVDGVHVLSLGDVVPASARSIDITIRHAESGAEETKTLPMGEYSGERVPTEYAPALIIVGLAIAVLVILLLPGPPSLGAFEMRIASKTRTTSIFTLFSQLFGKGRHAAISAIATAIIAAFALTPYVVSAEVDGVAFYALAASLLVWSRVAMQRGFVASLRTLFQTTAAVVMMAASLALTIGQLGAIELAEIVRVQGGVPWHFAAASHPSCTLAAIVYGVSVVTILRARPNGAGVAPSSSSHAFLLERGGLLFASALFVIAFFGGWQLPGVDPHRLRGMLFAATTVFVAKTWIVTALLLGASRVASRFSMHDIFRVSQRRLVPALLLAGAFLVASRKLVPSSAIETAIGATLVALVTLFLIRLVARVHAARSRPEPHASPFL